MRATVQSLTVELLDRVSGRDEIEVLGDLAYDLPAVCHRRPGVAVQDRAAIRDWSASFAVFLGNYAGIPDAYRGAGAMADLSRSPHRRAAHRAWLYSADGRAARSGGGFRESF